MVSGYQRSSEFWKIWSKYAYSDKMKFLCDKSENLLRLVSATHTKENDIPHNSTLVHVHLFTHVHVFLLVQDYALSKQTLFSEKKWLVTTHLSLTMLYFHVQVLTEDHFFVSMYKLITEIEKICTPA